MSERTFVHLVWSTYQRDWRWLWLRRKEVRHISPVTVIDNLLEFISHSTPETLRVTSVSTDTLTVVRGQENDDGKYGDWRDDPGNYGE